MVLLLMLRCATPATASWAFITPSPRRWRLWLYEFFDDRLIDRCEIVFEEVIRGACLGELIHGARVVGAETMTRRRRLYPKTLSKLKTSIGGVPPGSEYNHMNANLDEWKEGLDQ